MITQTCRINMVPGGMPPIIHVSQYDAGSRDLTFELYNGAMPWTAPSGATVTIDGTKPDKKAFSVAATISGSTVTATLTQQMAAAAGRAECQLKVTKGENVLGSANFILDVERAALSEDADMSATDISSVETAKTQAISAMQKAQAAQAAAEVAKTAAEAATSSKADKGDGLWIFTSIPSGADLNDYTACGYYRVSDNSTVSTLSNCPVSKSFTMEVSNAVGKTDSGAITGTTWRYRIQRVTDYETREYVRLVYTNGSGTVTFSTWKKMLTNDDWTALKAEITPTSIGAMTDGAGLWGFTDLPSGADLNDYTACGFYKYSYDDSTFSIQNSPARAAFTMQVMNACGYGDHDAIGGKALKYRLQKLTTWQGDEYVRQAYTDSSGSVTYGAWKTILNNGALGITSGSWTPTVSGAASYTIQTGRYIKIGDMAVVTFSVYGTFAGSTTGRIKVSGCPLTPVDSITAGGGHLSGYTAASNIIFTGWNTNTNGSFYAVGQETATTGANKWGSEAIYQKASEEFSASGTIAFKVAD